MFELMLLFEALKPTELSYSFRCCFTSSWYNCGFQLLS